MEIHVASSTHSPAESASALAVMLVAAVVLLVVASLIILVQKVLLSAILILLRFECQLLLLRVHRVRRLPQLLVSMREMTVLSERALTMSLEMTAPLRFILFVDRPLSVHGFATAVLPTAILIVHLTVHHGLVSVLSV